MNKLSIRIVIIFLLATVGAGSTVYIINPFYSHIFTDPTWYPIQRTAELVQYIIDNTPQKNLNQEIDYLSSILDRRLEIISADDASVPKEVKQRITGGRLVHNVFKDGEERFFAPVHGGTLIVLIDPSYQQYRTLLDNRFVGLIYFTTIIITIITGIWFANSITRRMKILEDAAKKIHQGDFTARVQDISVDLIGDVEKCFNHMAQRIQSLITYRQNLLITIINNFRVPIARLNEYLKELNIDPEIKSQYEKIDRAIDNIESLVSDLLIKEKNRLNNNIPFMESSQRGRSLDESDYGYPKKVELNGKYKFAIKRPILKLSTVKFILRICGIILIVQLTHQLLMMAVPLIQYNYTDINPKYYPKHTMATLIQRAIDVTPEQELHDVLDVLKKRLNRVDLVSKNEAKNIFIRTSKEEFAGGITYGTVNGRKVFNAPVYSGTSNLMIDNPSFLYRQKINILYHSIVFINQFAFTIFFGILLSIPLIKDLKKLRDGIEMLQMDDLSSRVDIPQNKLIGRLAHQFNDMAERIQSILDDQQQLVRAVVHDIRTPVSSMRFYLEMLLDAEDKQEIKSQTRNFKKQIEELNLLIKELSTLTSLDGMKDELSFGPIYIYQTLKEIGAQYQKTNPLTHIFLLNDREDNLKIYAHPILFKMAVQNILSNAIRHAQNEVSLHYISAEDGIFIEICDDGPGIPINSRKAVFEPFIRLDDSRNRKSGGFGLGLAIVKRIIQLHRGSVSIADNHPHGAKIITYWPSSSLS